MMLEGVTIGGVGRHAVDLVAADGPHALVPFLKVWDTRSIISLSIPSQCDISGLG